MFAKSWQIVRTGIPKRGPDKKNLSTNGPSKRVLCKTVEGKQRWIFRPSVLLLQYYFSPKKKKKMSIALQTLHLRNKTRYFHLRTYRLLFEVLSKVGGLNKENRSFSRKRPRLNVKAPSLASHDDDDDRKVASRSVRKIFGKRSTKSILEATLRNHASSIHLSLPGN